jgi:hypothetical protein
MKQILDNCDKAREYCNPKFIGCFGPDEVYLARGMYEYKGRMYSRYEMAMEFARLSGQTLQQIRDFLDGKY